MSADVRPLEILELEATIARLKNELAQNRVRGSLVNAARMAIATDRKLRNIILTRDRQIVRLKNRLKRAGVR